MGMTNNQCQTAFHNWSEASEHIIRKGKAIVSACQDADASASKKALPKIKSDQADYRRLIDTYRPEAYKARRECKAGGLSTAQFKTLGDTLDKVDAQLRIVNNWVDKIAKLK